jgi:hypothetical protein
MRVKAEPVVLTGRDVALLVGKEELVLLTRYQGAADVLNEAKDIRDVLPGLVLWVRVRGGGFRIQV